MASTEIYYHTPISTYFPIKVQYESGEEEIIQTSKELPYGKPFYVIELNVKEK